MNMSVGHDDVKLSKWVHINTICFFFHSLENIWSDLIERHGAFGLNDERFILFNFFFVSIHTMIRYTTEYNEIVKTDWSKDWCRFSGDMVDVYVCKCQCLRVLIKWICPKMVNHFFEKKETRQTGILYCDRYRGGKKETERDLT